MKHGNNNRGLSQISKIRKLANKKGTPLLEVNFRKKSIHFQYKSGFGVIGFSYPSIQKGIVGELRRLER